MSEQATNEGGAEVLRRAAALMRKRAERTAHEDPASGDGWFAHLGPAGTSWINNRHGHLISTHGFPCHAEHIASWHPAVALAVAKAMDDVAEAWEIADGWALDPDDDLIRFEDTIDGGWLTVAHAYLGSDS